MNGREEKGGEKRGKRKEGRRGGKRRKVEKGNPPAPSNIEYWMVHGSYMGGLPLPRTWLLGICQASPFLSSQIYKCDNERCPRPDCYRSCSSNKEDVFKCERPRCEGYFRLLR